MRNNNPKYRKLQYKSQTNENRKHKTQNITNQQTTQAYIKTINKNTIN